MLGDLKGRGVLVSVLAAAAACVSCSASSADYDWTGYQPPDWRKYQAKNVSSPSNIPGRSHSGANATGSRFTFADLKSESDESLARRLLGEVGRRIALVDRHRDRWQYYKGDDSAAESIDLYTRPYALGSQFGLCGVERYSIEFDDDGRIESVAVTQRYGVEGPIFQKADFDWDHYYNVMCASAPATHAPSYFPATDSLMADDAAELLVALFDIASSQTVLPFKLECRSWQEKKGCSQGVREYLGRLRLEDIDEFGLVNCPLGDAPPNSVCFTVTTGVHQLGPFPKYITVKGSTHMNNVRIDSVDVLESFTVS